MLFEDAATLLGLIVAFVGIFLTHYFNNPYLDGAASVVIGVILATVAVLLVYESKGLLIGEGANAHTLESIRKLAEADPGVKKMINPLTMYFGPYTVLLTVDIEFHDTLSAIEVEEAVDRLEKRISTQYLDIKHIYIEAGAVRAGGRETFSQK